jgi:hypothetical protein
MSYDGKPSLDQLTDQPQIAVTIGGQVYRFSELSIAALGRLQALIKETMPHPVQALKGHLDGLAAADREFLLKEAYRDARSWPPVVGTAAGAAALLSSEPGQIAALYEGLLVHQPQITQADVVRIFRALRRDAAREAAAARQNGQEYDGEGTARRIFAALFGLGIDEDSEPLPKD